MAQLSVGSLKFLMQLEAARLQASEANNPDLAWRPAPDDLRVAEQNVGLGRVQKLGEKYRITAIGQLALRQNGVEEPDEPENGVLHTLTTPEVPTTPTTPPAQAEPPKQKNNGQSSGCICDQCIYRQAFGILAARLPEARELLTVLEKIEHIGQ